MVHKFKIFYIFCFLFIQSCSSESSKPTEPEIPEDTKPIVEDIQISTDEFTSVEFTLTGTDLLNRELSYQYYSDPSHGSLSCCVGNKGTYYPSEYYYGTDSFEYVAITANGYISEPATVSITINPNNTKVLKNVKLYDGGSYAKLGDAVMDNDGIVISGEIRQYQQPDKLYVLKVDLNGELLWETILEDDDNGINGRSLDILNGNYIVKDQYHLYSISNSGTVLWSKEFGGTRVGTNQKNNLIIVATPKEYNGSNDDQLFTAFDSNGNQVWQKSVETEQNVFTIYDIVESNEGEDGFIIVGGEGADPFALKLDIDGNIVWRYQYSSFTGYAFNIEQFGENFLISGFNEVQRAGSWLRAGLVFEINSSGSMVWSKTYDSIQPDMNRDSRHSHLSHSMQLLNTNTFVSVGYGPVLPNDARLMFIYEDRDNESNSFIKGLQNEVYSYEYYVPQSSQSGGWEQYRIFQTSSSDFIVISTTTMNDKIFVSTLNLSDANY